MDQTSTLSKLAIAAAFRLKDNNDCDFSIHLVFSYCKESRRFARRPFSCPDSRILARGDGIFFHCIVKRSSLIGKSHLAFLGEKSCTPVSFRLRFAEQRTAARGLSYHPCVSMASNRDIRRSKRCLATRLWAWTVW